MSGTLPSSPAFNSLTIKSNNPNIVTISTSGRRQVKTQQSQYWSFVASYPAMKRSEWAPIAAFVVKQRGAYESWTVVLPDYSDTNGALNTESVTVDGNHGIGDTSITVNGPTTLSGALKAGDFIKFADHNKVYMVTEDVNFSGGGSTINIEPGLQVAVSTTTAVEYKDVEFTVFLTNDVQEFNTGLAGVVQYEIEFREAL